MKIGKEFRWEMGHRLPDHFGKCKNIHGHSYKMFVEFSGELDKSGMIIDYYDIEKMINPVIEKLDHAFMVNKNDKLLVEFLAKIDSKRIIVDFESTAENICRYLLTEILKSQMPDNIHKIKIRVQETAGDYAEESFILNRI